MPAPDEPPPAPRRSPVSRRATLRVLGAAPAVGAAPALDALDPPGGTLFDPRVTVMTRNLGLGTNVRRLFGSSEVDPGTVAHHFEEVLESDVPRRAAAVAAEIADARPALVGLQEAALVRTERPGDYEGGSTPDAETVAVDFLAELGGALDRELADRGADTGYRPVAAVRNADEELPAAADGERFDVRLTIRDAVLAREDVRVGGTETDNYGVAAFTTLSDGTRVRVARGYCLVRARVGAARLVFVDTHLASTASFVRAAQARELLDRLARVDDPVVLVGDLNTGPGTADPVYGTLTGEFTDAAAAAGATGPTCCQWSNLRNERSLLHERVDHVLCRGADPLSARRVGADPGARVPVTIAGERREVWPSDHAGVVADLRVSASLSDPLDVVRAVFSGE